MSEPDRLWYSIEARRARHERALDRAVEDLASTRLWTPLTAGLHGIRLRATAGAEGIPRDGHLADASLSRRTGYLVAVRVCHVEFFPAAIRADLGRQHGYHALGRFPEPPSLRDFWAALLAHELSHCRRGPHGEVRAMAWEARALRALEG